MCSSVYTPSKAVNMENEKDWQANLGMLGWDDTSIVFTKRTLIEFLKYTGTTVDPNFTNISKLPRYAKFGTISTSAGASSAQGAVLAENENIGDEASVDFKPSQRVRAPPGGKHSAIFDNDDLDNDALSQAPPKAQQPATEPVPPSKPAQAEFEPLTDFKPTRRVRTTPGGHDSIGGLWDAPDAPEELKPSRRVRQIPGGQDNVSGIF